MKILTDGEYKRLIAMLHQYESKESLARTSTSSFETGMPISQYLVKLKYDLAPMISGTTPVKTTGNYLYSYDGSNVVDSGITADVYNFGSVPYSAGSLQWVNRDPISGGFFIITGQPLLEGKLTGPLTVGGTQTMKVYTGSGLDWSWNGETITVQDRAGWSGDVDLYVMAIFINGEWRPVVIGCPP